MKIYEVTGKKIRENPQEPNMQQGKVVSQSGDKITVATQANGQPTGTQFTVNLNQNPNAIQKDPQGNVTVDPNAPADPTSSQLQPGQTINVVGAAPGAMLPNQQSQQDQQAAEEMDAEEDPEMVEAGYIPNGYNDDYREKAMMRKAFQSVTQDEKYFEETNHIVALAKRVSNVKTTAPINKHKDIVDIKKLAGL
ncbi:MAG: hypothetical protein EBT86_08430 [Actinobacteria bacterium]|nr:hypothetical protein [Actinomycetota bacterium]